MVIGFATVILIGAILLTLPIVSNNGLATPFVDALFTATSAVCVTGLVVVDTATHWNLFGQIIIIILIQVGGLGFMTITTLFALITKKRINLKERLLIQEADRKSTRLNSSHANISYAVFCLKKKKNDCMNLHSEFDNWNTNLIVLANCSKQFVIAVRHGHWYIYVSTT